MKIKESLKKLGEDLYTKNIDGIHDFSKLEVRDLVVGALFEDGHIHSAHPDNEANKLKILEDLLQYYPVLSSKKSADPPKEIIFHNRQAFGDILTMTCLYYHSPILLENGKTDLIGSIVNNKKASVVSSFNRFKNIFENKKVTNWIKHDIGKHEWYRITYEYAPMSQVTKCGQGVYLTEDHEILTDRGMIRVDKLLETDKILTKEKCLNEEQKNFFTGAILGDGYLRKSKTKGRGYFSYGHYPPQSEFISLKNNALNGFEFSTYKYKKKDRRKNRCKEQNIIISQYRSNVEFGKLQSRWYKNGKKIVPLDLNENEFSPLTLATWYMDDGSINGDWGAIICSEAFSKDENQILLNILNKKFGLNIKLRKCVGGTGYRLYIGNGHRYSSDKSADKFFEIIAPFIPDSMKYKLPNKYRNIPFDFNLWNIGCANFYYAKPIIKQISPSSVEYSRYVYCLEIEDNHNFVSNNMVFSNCAIRDFKKQFPETRVGVSTTAMHIWDNNPNVDHTFNDPKHILKTGPGFLTNRSNTWNLHMCNAFRLDVEAKLGVSIEQGPIRPDIWMTKEEMERPPLIEGPYWVFIYGGEPGWPTKQYHRWQEVINLLDGEVKFVQLGVKSHPYPALNGCINYIGKTEDRNTGIRDLFNIFLHAQGSLGLVSMHMHLSAAFNNCCVTVAGAREPAWFTNYFGHQYVQTNGTMFCSETKACWACKLEACRNKVKMSSGAEVPKCVEIIEPEEIAEAVRKYYKGGRLEYGKKVPNNFFKNIVGEKKVFSFTAPAVTPADKVIADKTELTFGGSSITERDWLFIKDIIQNENIKTVLEFGAGLATVMTGQITEKVLTYETMSESINKISAMVTLGKHIFRKWDGVNFKLEEGDPQRFDFAFVDGPSGGGSREFSTKAASELADIVIIHDAGRVPERAWQEKYLKENFEMTAKGGHRCHLWKRKDKIQVEKTRCDMLIDKPIAKVITTTRGYGGSERSTIEIMAMLQQKGYHVQLSPTGDMSWEYKKNIPQDVQLVDWRDIEKPVDVAILYASDTIWNYGKPLYTDTMPKLNAKRKVMVLNFKIGGAGIVEWTKNWDKYLFLNSQHAGELLLRLPDAKTKVMAPPTDLTAYFENEPDYNFPLKLIRHSSQGDSKHHPDNNKMIQEILALDSTIQFHFMPARSDCMDHPNVFKYKKNVPPVNEFLRNGNCMIYRLPDGYSEGGPKVCMESMSSGLAVICDNHSGMKDRVTQETGWLCNNWNDYIEAIKEILNNPEILVTKGKAARIRAFESFGKEVWIDEILGDTNA